MEKITPVAELKISIQSLEVELAEKGLQLKEQFFQTYESLKPINLLNSTLKEISSSPLLIDNILGTVMGLASGYLSKRLFLGSSGNILRKLIGSVLQFGVTNLVAQHPDAFKSLGRFIFQRIFRKKESISENNRD